MYNETNVPGPEYRVRPVVRYVVTRYCHPYEHVGDGSCPSISVCGRSEVIAEVPNEETALDIADKLIRGESGAY